MLHGEIVKYLGAVEGTPMLMGAPRTFRILRSETSVACIFLGFLNDETISRF